MSIVLDHEKDLAFFYSQVEAALASQMWIKNHCQTINKRAKNIGMPGVVSKQELAKMYIYFDLKCTYCKVPLPAGRNDNFRTVDHLKPKHKGGKNVVSNIVPCCKTCNTRKDKKDVYIWLKLTVGIEQAEHICHEIGEYQAWLQRGGDYGKML